MDIILGISSILIAFITALFLQLPTFVLPLGYWWSHNYPAKRWVLRLLGLITYILFLFFSPPLLEIILVSIPFLFFWVFSLFNANPNLFIALNETQLIKQRKQMYDPNAEVVGYVDEQGKAICYPVNEMIMPRHLLNDVFEGKPLLISFCAACRSTMVYNPVVDGQRLNFQVVGVHRRNMVIRDIETGTIWQQGTGEAMYGKLKGKRLDFYAYQQMTLEQWIQEYPDTFIAQEGTNIKKSFVPNKRFMKVINKVTATFIAPGITDLTGLAEREKIWGLEYNGINKAYPISELKRIKQIIDKVGDSEIEITYNPENNQIIGKNLETNEKLKFQNHWWFGWKEFHPDTEIWKFE